MSRENEQTIAVYEQYGQNYLNCNAEDIINNLKAKRDDERQIELLRNYTKGFPPEATIFEVGSASGRDAKTLIRLGYHNITVSDVADFFINYLKQCGLSPIKFNLITDSFPSKYDIILCWAVLVHFQKDEAIDSIKKIYEALNDAGAFIFCVKHKKGHEGEWEDYKGRIGDKRFFTYWDKDELHGILSEIGFEDISIEQRGGSRACWLNCCAKKKEKY